MRRRRARFIPARPMPSIHTPLLYSTYSREARPELDERRAQPPRLELGHALHELFEVLFCDVLEVVEVAGDVEDRVFEFRGPVVLDPFEQALLAGLRFANRRRRVVRRRDVGQGLDEPRVARRRRPGRDRLGRRRRRRPLRLGGLQVLKRARGKGG